MRDEDPNPILTGLKWLVGGFVAVKLLDSAAPAKVMHVGRGRSRHRRRRFEQSRRYRRWKAKQEAKTKVTL